MRFVLFLFATFVCAVLAIGVENNNYALFGTVITSLLGHRSVMHDAPAPEEKAYGDAAWGAFTVATILMAAIWYCRQYVIISTG